LRRHRKEQPKDGGKKNLRRKCTTAGRLKKHFTTNLGRESLVGEVRKGTPSRKEGRIERPTIRGQQEGDKGQRKKGGIHDKGRTASGKDFGQWLASTGRESRRGETLVRPKRRGEL